MVPEETMRRLRNLALVGLLMIPGQARADEADEELAKRHYKLGATLYHRSEFEGALKQFNLSYKLSKKSALLFNIARCHESLGQHSEAIAAYEEFLKSNPRNPENIRIRIRNLRRLIEKKKKDEPTPSPPDEPKAPAAVTPTTDTPTGTTTPGDETPVPEQRDRPSRPLRLTGWILAGSGVALLGTGVALGLMARSKQSELEDANAAGAEYSDYESTHDQGETFNKAGIAMMVVGGLAAAGGAVLVVLDWRANRERRSAWVAPTVTVGGAAVTAGFKF
jgi:tetratricopeptide (TPR) repeat protein